MHESFVVIDTQAWAVRIGRQTIENSLGRIRGGGERFLEPDLTRCVVDRHKIRECAPDIRPDFETACGRPCGRSEAHTSELQALMPISYSGFCWQSKRQRYTSLQIT